MTYNANEISLQNGAPIEFYEFKGTYITYRYTNTNRAVVLGGQTFIPIDISRNEAKVTSQEDTDVYIDVSMPFDTQVVVDYGLNVAPPDLVLTIYRAHVGDNWATDFVTYWKGAVTMIAFDGGVVAKARVPSQLSGILNQNAPKVQYQRQCNWTLYDSNTCKLSEGANSFATTVTSVSADRRTIGVAGVGALTKLKAGEIRLNSSSERRTIVGVTTGPAVITVAFSFSANVKVGDSVTLVNGCDHIYTSANGCAGYSNQANFGGTKDIPDDNMFASGL